MAGHAPDVIQDIPLDIVHEDEHLIVINKAAGMVVHPGPGNYTGTLVNALLHRFGMPAVRLRVEAAPEDSELNEGGTPSLILCAVTVCYRAWS